MDLGQRRTPFQDDRYDLLALVIEFYESQKYPRQKTDPIRQIKFAMEQHGFRQRDMVKYFGSRSRYVTLGPGLALEAREGEEG